MDSGSEAILVTLAVHRPEYAKTFSKMPYVNDSYIGTCVGHTICRQILKIFKGENACLI